MKLSKKSLWSSWGHLQKTKKAYSKLTVKEQNEQCANILRGKFDFLNCTKSESLKSQSKSRNYINRYYKGDHSQTWIVSIQFQHQEKTK